MFTQNEKLWHPDFNWCKYVRPLVITPEYCYVEARGRGGVLQKVLISDLHLEPPPKPTVTRRRLKLSAGDAIVHEEFGEGIVEYQQPDVISIRFAGGTESVKNNGRNIVSVNGLPYATLMRRQILEEAYEASQYSMYDPAFHDLPFSEIEIEYPELVATLDSWCIQQGTMKIGCNPSYENRAKARLAAAGAPDLAQDLHIGQSSSGEAEEGHGMWVNIYIPDPQIQDIDKTLSIFFNPRGLVSTGRYMLAKLQYTTRLLGKMAMDAPGDEITDPLLLD